MGAIKVGSTDILEIYVGSTPVSEVYVGSTLIWSSSASTFTVTANFNTLSNSGGLDASVSFSYGVTDFTLTSQPSWVSSVTQTTSSGKTTGFTFDYDPNAGTSTRTGSITFFAAGASRSVSLTQAGTAVVSVTGVTLNTWSLNLTVGQTQTLTATVSPSNATNKSVTWSSSNTSVATVSQSGEVTAIANGTATITVTTQDGGYTDTCDATVAALTLSVSPESLTFDYGDSDSSAKKSIAITTNQSWSAVASSDFAIYGPTSGTGDYTIQVYPTSSNTGQTDRTGSVTITAANNVSKTVGIIHYAQTYSMSVSPSSMEFDYDDNTYYEGQDVTITADHAWTATISSGFGIGSSGSSTASGSAGTTTLRIYPTSNNNTSSDRTGTFTVNGTASGFVRSVSLTQAVNPSIYVTVTDALSFTGTGSTETITITGTVSSWEITSAPSWCSYASASGTSSTIAITASANNTGDSRIDQIELTINGISGYIVSVDQPDASAVNYRFSISASPSGCTIYINNVERSYYDCPAGTSISWSVEKTGYTTQTGTYTMTAANHTETVTLALAYSISVTDGSNPVSSLTFAATDDTYNEGKTIYVNSQNQGWTASVPTGFTLSSNSGSSGASAIRVYPSSTNSSSTNKTGTLTFTGNTSGSVSVSLTQEGTLTIVKAVSDGYADNEIIEYGLATYTVSPLTAVTWSVTSGDSLCETEVDNGQLTVTLLAEAEIGDTITIRATSTADNTKYATLTITVVEEEISVPTSIDIVTPPTGFEYSYGSYSARCKSATFEAECDPQGTESLITWELRTTSGGTWTQTNMVSIEDSVNGATGAVEGLLTVTSAASSWTQLRVYAVSTVDSTVYDYINIVVNYG